MSDAYAPDWIVTSFRGSRVVQKQRQCWHDMQIIVWIRHTLILIFKLEFYVYEYNMMPHW